MRIALLPWRRFLGAIALLPLLSTFSRAQPPEPDWTFTYDTGGGFDTARGLAIGPAGDVFVAGSGGSLPSATFFALRMSESGPPPIWDRVSNHVIGDYYALWRPISVADDGSTYISGNIQQPGQDDFWVMQFLPSGEVGWTYTINSPGNRDIAIQTAIDNARGRLYAAGFVGTNNVVASLDLSTGEQQWLYTHPNPQGIYGLALDSLGNIYAAGGPIVKLNPEGEVEWLYASATISSLQLVLDDAGFVYGVGRGSGEYPTSQLGVVKLSPDGVEQWISGISGWQYHGHDITLDGSGNVIACGAGRDASEDALALMAGFSTASGAVQWHWAMDGVDGAELDYVEARNGKAFALGRQYGLDELWLIQLNPSTGAIDWHYRYSGETGGGANGYGLAVYDNAIYVCGADWGRRDAFIQRFGGLVTAINGVSEERVNASPEGILVSWDAIRPSPYVAFYIDRAEGSANSSFKRLAESYVGRHEAENLSYLDRNVTPGSVYRYRIAALRRDGREDLSSEILMARAWEPLRPMLGLVHPNPMDDVAVIPYELPASDSPIRIEILDATGRKLRGLLDERQAGGRTQISWDRRADNGRLAGAGVYFLRLTSEDRVETTKLVVK